MLGARQKEGSTYIFLANRIDNCFDDTFHDTDMIRIELVVTDPL